MAGAAYISMDGDLVAHDDARVHVLSPIACRALSVFETVRGYRAGESDQVNLFRLDDHLVRLAQSMMLLRFDKGPSAGTLRSWVIEAVRANGLRDDCHLRIMAFIDGAGGALTARGPVRIAITAAPRLATENDRAPLRCLVSSWTRISDNAIPPRMKSAGNYQNSRLAMMQAQDAGFDSAILLNERGKVAEAPLANVFALRDGVAITPSSSSGILEGITRDTVLTLLHEDFDIECEAREVDRTELYLASEVFLCSTGLEIKPVVAVDGQQIGKGEPGRCTKTLHAAYLSLVRGMAADHQDWLTPVYG